MSSPIGNFAGIGSGFDYTDLVNGIIQSESQPATDMQNRIDLANSQITAYKSYSSLLSTVDTAAQAMSDGSAFQSVSANVFGATSSTGQTLLSASATAGADPGSYAIQVLQVAQAEKLSGSTFASSSTALGYSGNFIINGKTITIAATDTLGNIRDKINAANTGTSPSGVSAAIVTDSPTQQRLVLTSQQTGSAGIDLIDGSQGVAQQLGWLDTTTTIKHPTSAGAQSDTFASASDTIASQLGLTSPTGTQTVTIGGQSVDINLDTDSLNSIAAKLSSLTGIQATVQSTTTNGTTESYLDIRNTTNFVDAGNTLEQLGVVNDGRSAVAQQLQSAALTDGNSTTAATASTLLTNVWNGGSASNAQAGDTLTVTGTRGDGSAVNLTFTVGATSTVQDLLDTLNNTTNGFGAGTRPATASIDASGHIVVTDNTAGGSSLNVQIVAHNENGGRLDLGDFGTTSAGRSRELVAGADAKFTVDGVPFTRSTNNVSDVIADTTLTLTAADPNTTATVSIDRSETQAQSAVQSFVDAYNNLIDFIQQQQTAAPTPTDPTQTSTASNPPLYNDPLLRLAQSALPTTLLTSVFGTASDMSTAGMVGISFTKDGHLSFDTSKFQTAFTTRYNDVQKLFMQTGTSTNSSLIYTNSTSASQSGNYDVNITQSAQQAQVLGTGFSGTYTDDGTPDTISITDPSNNYTAQVQLANGMTTDQIVNALNTAFSTPQAQVIGSDTTFTDASGTAPATTATNFLDLHAADGSPFNVAAGDTISFGGTRSDGSSYNGTFAVTATSTLGDFISQLQSTLGTGAAVSLTNGQLTVQSQTAGLSSLTLSLTANNQGGGTLNMGSMNVTTPGRGIMTLKASNVNGQLQILDNSFGSAASFSVAFSGGGTDSTAQLGLSTGSFAGTDVAGTIGGYAATGSGRQLVGNTGTPVDGLSVTYTDTAIGAVGTVNLTQGVGAMVDQLISSWTDVTGAIALKESSLNDRITDQQSQLDAFNTRLDLRKQTLLQQYLNMDTTVQRLQSQGNAFLAALGSGSSSSSSSSSVFG